MAEAFLRFSRENHTGRKRLKFAGLCGSIFVGATITVDGLPSTEGLDPLIT